MYFLNPIGHDHQPDVNRLGLTQEIGSAREEGTILLPGPAVVNLRYRLPGKSPNLNVSIGISTYILYIIIDILN